jgi:hypothetical protein
MDIEFVLQALEEIVQVSVVHVAAHSYLAERFVCKLEFLDMVSAKLLYGIPQPPPVKINPTFAPSQELRQTPIAQRRKDA